MNSVTQDLPVLNKEQEKFYREMYNSGVKRFPVGKKIPCVIDGYETTGNSIILRLKWGPYQTEEGLYVRHRYGYIEYTSFYNLLKLVKMFQPDATFLDSEDPEFWDDIGNKLKGIEVLANSIEIIDDNNKLNITKVVYLSVKK